MASKVAFPLSFNSQPEEGVKGLPYNLDFTAVTAFNFDIAIEQQSNMIATVQSVWIDNHANLQPMTIAFGSSLGHVLQIRAGRQGVYPVFSTSGILRIGAFSTGAVIVPIILFNVQLTPWYQDI